MTTLEVTAAAKINLGLGVLSRRSDGFHELDTVMVRLDLADRILLEPLVAPKVIGVALPSTDPFVGPSAPPVDASNLAVRAAHAYLGAAGWPGGVRLSLAKEIPIAAGLGGGSSDAAAVLRALTTLYPSGVDIGALAARLGSDVPFFASGWPAARAQGRGERLEALIVPVCHALLVNPGAAIAAGDAYSWLAAPRGRLAFLAEPGPCGGPLPELRNDLEPGVVATVPAVAAALAALAELRIGPVAMSGSGATCFALVGSQGEALDAANTLAAKHPTWWVRAVRFPVA